MSPIVLPLVEIGARLLDKVLPDPQAKAAAQLELLRLQQTGDLAEMDAQVRLSLAQLEVNKAEAQTDIFRGGWRPAVGWTCAAGLAYQLVVRPILGWAGGNVAEWTPPPALEMDTLMTLLFGMLGLGAFRTAEKIKAVGR